MTSDPDTSAADTSAADDPAADQHGEGVALVIDGRGRGLAAAPLLGLTLPARAVFAGRRAGMAHICLVTGEPAGADSRAFEGKAERTGAPPEGVAPRPTIWLAPGVVAEVDWLRQAVAQCPAAGKVEALGPGVAAAGRGASLADLADAAEKAAGGGLDILRVGSGADRGADREADRGADLRGDRAAAERRLMAALVKDTDGFMARHFARPISLFLSRRLARTPVTPNQMTVVSLLIGLAAAPFFLFSAPWLQAIGGALFVAHSVVDGCDGELARLKFTESRFGGLLDFWSDNLVHLAVFGCMGAGWVMAEGALWPLWFMAGALLGTGGSALAVYVLTLRPKASGGAADAGAGPVYTSVAAGPSDRLTRALDDLSRRDFIYLVFALSLFGKAAWFLAAAGIGAPVFLVFVLFLAWRRAR